MSVWEYSSYVEGWQKAHEIDKEREDDGMTPELFRTIMDAPVGGYRAH